MIQNTFKNKNNKKMKTTSFVVLCYSGKRKIKMYLSKKKCAILVASLI